MTGEMDQQRFKALMKETITLLCNNGLNFKSEFTIEAVIGITIDRESILLVSIQDTVTNYAKSTSASQLVRADYGENEFAGSPSARLAPPRDTNSQRSGAHERNCADVVEVAPEKYEDSGLVRTHFGKSTDGLNIKLEQTENDEELKSEYLPSSSCENVRVKSSFPSDKNSPSRAEVRNLDPLRKARFLNSKRHLLSPTQPADKMDEDLPGAANASRNDRETSAFANDLSMTRILESYATEEAIGCRTSLGYADADNAATASPDHILKSNIDLPKIYSARVCDALPQSSQNMQRTPGCTRKTSTLNPYQCKICGKRIGSRHSLDVHEATVHLGKYRYSCPNCGKGYSVLSNLRAHIACKHNKRKEFVCGFCGREYGYKHSLKEHIMLVHSGNMSFGLS